MRITRLDAKVSCLIVLITWHASRVVHGLVHCSEDRGRGVCPDLNTCCPTVVKGISGCITHSHKAPGIENTGECCKDLLTGCGYGYSCASSYIERNNGVHNSNFCQAKTESTANKSQNETVQHIMETNLLTEPRYSLCTLSETALDTTYGFPIPSSHWRQEENNRLRTDESKSQPALAYLSNMGSIDSKRNFESVRVLFVIIHGSGRNADDYLCAASSVADLQSRYTGQDEILIIAPRFLAVADGFEEEPLFLRWNETWPIAHTWRYGAESLPFSTISSGHHSSTRSTSGITVSSYAAVDALLEHIVFDTSRFPNLERVIVTGHSAGGQFVQRWSLTSSSPIWDDSDSFKTKASTHDLLPIISLTAQERRLSSSFRNEEESREIRAIPVRVVVANPRSFAYLSEERFMNGTWTIPSRAVRSTCPGYNQWEWGLEEGGRLDTPYKDNALKHHELESLRKRYAARDVMYLAGKEDTEMLRSSCEDDWFQGSFRYERSNLFFEHLKRTVKNDTRHERLVVREVGHDHTYMYQSETGLHALFSPTNKELQIK
jgi:hypothetical protein